MSHDDPSNPVRRRIVGAGLGAAGAAALSSLPLRAAIAQGGEVVVAAAPPITGVFAFAGTGLHQGLGDYCQWRNEAKKGVAGRTLRYVGEDSGYKMDQAMAVFKKLMAAHRPPVFYGDSTAWAKAAAAEVSQLGTTLTSSPSFSSDLADPKNAPYYFMAGPTYTAMGEILLEYIHRTSRGASKPAVAIVYSDTEFGRDPIPGIKAKARALQIPLVQEIVTKPGAVDVSSEVAKLRRAKPDYVIFHGYDTEGAPTMQAIKDFAAKARPNMPYVPLFYTHGWLVGMIFSEVIERTLKAGKPLTGANMKAALESIDNWDTGGVTGLLVSLKGHQIPSGRIYAYDAATKLLQPASGWIKTA
jgi:branched-chain amino acid transport system substrate-binding protein